jgi:hypothetical protein
MMAISEPAKNPFARMSTRMASTSQTYEGISLNITVSGVRPQERPHSATQQSVLDVVREAAKPEG